MIFKRASPYFAIFCNFNELPSKKNFTRNFLFEIPKTNYSFKPQRISILLLIKCLQHILQILVRFLLSIENFEEKSPSIYRKFDFFKPGIESDSEFQFCCYEFKTRTKIISVQKLSWIGYGFLENRKIFWFVSTNRSIFSIFLKKRVVLRRPGTSCHIAISLVKHVKTSQRPCTLKMTIERYVFLKFRLYKKNLAKSPN